MQKSSGDNSSFRSASTQANCASVESISKHFKKQKSIPLTEA